LKNGFWNKTKNGGIQVVVTLSQSLQISGIAIGAEISFRGEGMHTILNDRLTSERHLVCTRP